jgi:hypothetical protein
LSKIERHDPSNCVGGPPDGEGPDRGWQVRAMTEIWLGILLILGIAFLLLGCVGGIVFVAFKGSEWWLDRRQTRRFAEAVARGEFEKAETAARRAFQPAGTTDLAL